jgi:hypothetical protein
LRAKGGINKPSYYAYGCCISLESQRIAKRRGCDRDEDGAGRDCNCRMEPGGSRPERNGESISFEFPHVAPDAQVQIQRVDEARQCLEEAMQRWGACSIRRRAGGATESGDPRFRTPEGAIAKDGKMHLNLTPNTVGSDSS